MPTCTPLMPIEGPPCTPFVPAQCPLFASPMRTQGVNARPHARRATPRIAGRAQVPNTPCRARRFRPRPCRAPRCRPRPCRARRCRPRPSAMRARAGATRASQPCVRACLCLLCDPLYCGFFSCPPNAYYVRPSCPPWNRSMVGIGGHMETLNRVYSLSPMPTQGPPWNRSMVGIGGHMETLNRVYSHSPMPTQGNASDVG